MDGIIFDVDGTLWDSTEVVAKAWNEAIRQKTNLGITITADDLRSLFGKPLSEIMEALFPALGEEERNTLATECFHLENDWITKGDCYLYPGMTEGIKALSARYPIFVVSNCQEGYIESFLKATHLEEYVQDHLCPGDTGRLKAANIREIVEKHGLKKPVYVGDTQGDADACEEAGVPMVYCAYGLGKVKNPWKTISQFSDLLELFC